MTVLLPPIQFECLLFLLLIWSLWLGPLVLCWIRVVKVDTLVLLLILREILLVFAHWVWCWQKIFHMWHSLCWGMFPIFPLCWVLLYHKWVLGFMKCFFCIYWYDNVFFVFLFVYMMCHLSWFVNIVLSLYLWNKSHVIMMCDLFNVLLDLIY